MTEQEIIRIETARRAVVALSAKKEAKQKELELIRAELDVVMGWLPIGDMFQDPETGVVYGIVKPTGTFTYYKDVDYVRTRKDGEAKGTLAMKTAEDAGFVLPKGAEK